MADALVERAALVALLRWAGASWSKIAGEIRATGSAAHVLARALGSDDFLFPAEPSASELIARAAGEIAGWQAEGIAVRAFFDNDYPAQLRGITQVPPLLFSRGRSGPPDVRAVAVVGTRDASDEGLRVAGAVAAALSQRDVTVVSGLAKGIDTAAHQAALSAGGRTVAVLGTGIRRTYPAANRGLQEHIAQAGLVISQFWPDATPTRQSFPMRNAVMSGYAAATIVIEAGARSGARIQARLALRQGRPVVLTDQLMRHEWARSLAANPGVHVVGSTARLLDVVDDILDRMPDLAIV